METANCAICGETLTDPESVRLGVGPVCAAKQSRFLAAAGSSAEEIAALTLLGDPAVSLWLRRLAGAIGAGRGRDVQLFLTAARNAASVARSEAKTKAA